MGLGKFSIEEGLEISDRGCPFNLFRFLRFWFSHYPPVDILKILYSTINTITLFYFYYHKI
jgi:hypothetical protein